MAPNVGPTEIANNSHQANTEKGKEEIFYNGYFYDVTDFIRRHPGGNIIKFYTTPGEDATQAIDQFHYRAKNRVETIMKSFKKRKAETKERRFSKKCVPVNL